MVRVISQIGDSTDGEDYEELQKLSKKPNIIEKLNKYNTGYNISCILKEIGNQLLHSTAVKTEYKKIKDNLIPPNNKSEFKRLDSQFGRGFGLIINYYELNA